MRLRDVLSLSLKNIGFKGLRSWLTILGIVIGIASVVGLMSLGESINVSLNEQFSAFGTENIQVLPGSAQEASRMRPGGYKNNEYDNGEAVLTDEDVDELLTLPNIVAVSPLVSERLRMEFEDESITVSVNFVIPSEYEVIESFDFEEGYFMDDNDEDKIVIGYRIAHEVFDEEVFVGDILLFEDESGDEYSEEFRVAGILEEQGRGGSDDSVFMIVDNVELFDEGWDESYDSITVRASSQDVVNETSVLIKEALRNTHDISEWDEEDFHILESVSKMSMVGDVLNTITMLLTGIAAISLLVGVVSISNTMFTSVYERTREIGIMKAIGAKNLDIILLILVESVLISLIGGFGGIIMGIGLAQIMVSFAPAVLPGLSNGIRLAISFNILFYSLLLSIVIGALSGYLPARKASHLDPIKAITYE